MSSEMLVVFALTVGVPVWLAVEEMVSRLGRLQPAARLVASTRPVVAAPALDSQRAA